MKKASIALASLTALTSTVIAHPGPVGHSHDGTEEWPFPDFNWPMLLIATAVLCIVAGIYSLRKKQEDKK
ncbi:hypothetical protein [Rubritalea marina]|uniref:hypothetical protein n=1 Tax=Rubritalea marina TaxID=361055 RepID=UPI00037FC4DC|nr:hypothetical protein [Rubritalea marina]